MTPPSTPAAPASVSPADAMASGAYFGRDLEAMSFAVNYHRWILDRFAPYMGRRVAEVGAGTGSVSEMVLDTFPGIASFTAFEPSENMYPALAKTLAGRPTAQAVRGFFGVDANERALGDEASSVPFDTVLYVNVMEHIHDDVGELARAYDNLAPGGHLLVFVPALMALYSPLDARLGHARRYTRAELAGRVRAAGFEVRVAEYFDLAGIVPWYISFVLLGNDLGGGSVALYDRLVVPLMRRAENLARPPVGKNVLLVARRPLD